MAHAVPLRAHFGRAAEMEAAANWESAYLAYADLFRSALQLRSPGDIAAALRGQARARRQTGDLETAEELSVLSYEIALRNGMIRDAARAVNVTAIIRYSARDHGTALPLYRKALELAQDAGDDELIALAAQNVGIIHNMCGEFEMARAYYLESVAATLRSNDPRSALLAYMHLGIVCSDLDECMEADLYLSRALEIAERIGERMLLASVYVNRAAVLLDTGELEAARDALDNAERVAPGHGYPGTRSLIAQNRGRLARMQGDHGSAELMLLQAIGYAEQEDALLERAEALEELGRLRADEDRTALAHSALREARDAYLAAGAPGYAKRLLQSGALDGGADGRGPDAPKFRYRRDRPDRPAAVAAATGNGPATPQPSGGRYRTV